MAGSNVPDCEVYAARLSDSKLGASLRRLGLWFVYTNSKSTQLLCCRLTWIILFQDYKLKYQIATELRDSVEIYQSADYARFLQVLMPVFYKILNEGQPVFNNNDPQQVKWMPQQFTSFFVFYSSGLIELGSTETTERYTGDSSQIATARFSAALCSRTTSNSNEVITNRKWR